MPAWEIAVVMGGLALILVPGMPSVRFHLDESTWIAKSAMLEEFLQGDFHRADWNPSLARYLIGASRRAGGFSTLELNWPWDGSLTWAENRARGPSPALLWWGRLPMTLLAAVSGGLLYLLAVRAAGRLAGLPMLYLFLFNPVFTNHLRRAMSESPLLAFLLLSAVASVAALDYVRGLNWAAAGLLLRTIAAGMAAALSGASKLTGLAIAPAAVAIAALAGWRHRGGTRLARSGRAVLYGALAAHVGACLFLVLHPYLYARPLSGLWTMYASRMDTMRMQATWGHLELQTTSERWSAFGFHVFRFGGWADFPGAGILNAALAALGLGVLARRIVAKSGPGEQRDAALVVTVFGVLASLPSALSILSWNRYYLLPAAFCALFMAIGIGTVARRMVAR